MRPNPQMGVDIKLASELNWAGGQESDLANSDRGDFKLVDGSDNLRQALLRRLNTPLGGLWAHPEYGNGALNILSEPIDDSFKVMALDAIRNCIRAEPRAELVEISATEYAEERCLDFAIRYRELGSPRIDNLVWRLDRMRQGGG